MSSGPNFDIENFIILNPSVQWVKVVAVKQLLRKKELKKVLSIYGRWEYCASIQNKVAKFWHFKNAELIITDSFSHK